MVKQSILERRKFIRANRILSIQHRLAKGPESKWHLSMTCDMSVSGLAFLSDVSYRAGDTIELHVVMSGILDIFKGMGQVVRVTRKETGAFYLVAIKFVADKAVKQRTRKAKTYSRARKRITPLKKSPRRK